MTRTGVLGSATSIVSSRQTTLALKSALAAGLAWLLGSQLPPLVADYAYYASFGAVSVLYPTVSDSFREALRTTAAILAGALLAHLMQWVAFPNAVSVAAVVLLGTLAGAVPFLSEQRRWVVTAGLFMLVFGEVREHYLVG